MNTPNQDSTHKCFTCGEDLILIDVVTYTVGNSSFPVTKTRYRCSDAACQAESDKIAAKRLELKQEQDLARENRKKKSLTLSPKHLKTI